VMRPVIVSTRVNLTSVDVLPVFTISTKGVRIDVEFIHVV